MQADSEQPPIHLRMRPSRVLGLMVLTIHAAALTVVPALVVPFLGKLLLSLAVVGSLIQNLRRHVFLLSPMSIIQMVWQRSGEWSLMQRNGDVIEASLLPSTFVHHHLIVLNFRLDHPWQRPSVVLFDDAASAGTLRQLRVRLLTDQ